MGDFGRQPAHPAGLPAEDHRRAIASRPHAHRRAPGRADRLAARSRPTSATRSATALLGGGKRVRPLLAWHCAVAATGDPDARAPSSLPAGAAVELVHAFSLVHDDLPAMDDDDLRRGRPTLHIHAGEAMAILAGDAMLSLAAFAAARRPEPAGPPISDALHRLLARELVGARWA
jgi:geranylgeranyl pyrophosphate synthase